MTKFTSKDVARLAGVSQSTVSYVMSGKRPISEATRRKVLAAIDGLTYQPNAGARALASRRTSVVGLVIPFHPSVDAVAQLPFIQTIAAVAREYEHDVLLVTSDEGSAGLERIAGRSLCDAIVLMDIEALDERVPIAASLPMPVVLIGVPADPAGLYCVDLDFAAAARIVDELADRGPRQPGGHRLPGGDAGPRPQLRPPLRGRAPRTRGRARPADDEFIEPVEPGRAAADAAVQRALAGRDDRRLGLVVANAPARQHVLHALQDSTWSPGRDVSVMALCADAAAEGMEPPVTNVSPEPRDVSRRAMETLFWLLEPTPGPPPPPIDLLMPRLRRRGTVMEPGRKPR